MIERDLTACLQRAAGSLPAVTLTGPRQSGKSTLCRAVFGHLDYANLEAPDVRAFATEDPRGFLAQYPEGAVIDVLRGSHRALDELRNTYQVAPYLVYGGDRGQQRTDLSVLAWHAVQDAGW